jgi:hypothetical protein
MFLRVAERPHAVPERHRRPMDVDFGVVIYGGWSDDPSKLATTVC